MAASEFYQVNTPENIAWVQGFQAFRDGKGKNTNPYKKKSLRDAWEEGWEYAQRNPPFQP